MDGVKTPVRFNSGSKKRLDVIIFSINSFAKDSPLLLLTIASLSTFTRFQTIGSLTPPAYFRT